MEIIVILEKELLTLKPGIGNGALQTVKGRKHLVCISFSPQAFLRYYSERNWSKGDFLRLDLFFVNGI